MKSLTKAIAVASLATVASTAQAVEGLSTTIGAVSDYYFRGANLGDAGAYASLDYTVAGFYAGVWAIDDSAGGNNGLETDFYVGYGIELDGGVALDINYTRYEYTYDTGMVDLDDDDIADENITSQFEHEIGASVAVAGFSLAYAYGTAEAETDSLFVAGDLEQDYDVITLAYTTDVWGITVAQVDYDHAEDDNGEIDGSESEYKYVEFTASKEISGVDVSATIGRAFDIEEGGLDVASKGGEYMVLDVSKSFDL